MVLNPSQISQEADAILFLSWYQEDPDYLIGYQVKAAPIWRTDNLK
jgi:heptaprenylglyceryl phosphate synthase